MYDYNIQRVAATIDGDIKRWAVGKEGNLRALLSSLQHVRLLFYSILFYYFAFAFCSFFYAFYYNICICMHVGTLVWKRVAANFID